MPRFLVRSTVTVSLTKDVVAATETGAREAAQALELPQMCFQCAGNQGPEVWELNELDGEPSNIEVDPAWTPASLDGRAPRPFNPWNITDSTHAAIAASFERGRAYMLRDSTAIMWAIVENWDAISADDNEPAAETQPEVTK